MRITKRDLTLLPKVALGITKELELQYLSKENLQLLNKMIEWYREYDGNHWTNAVTGEALKPADLQAKKGIDYEPTMLTVKLASWLIDRRASFMFERPIALNAPVEQVDTVEQTSKPNYKPSPAQEAKTKKAQAREKLCYKVMKMNLMDEKLLKGAKDHLIAGSVCAKLSFKPGQGLRVVWRPRLEFWPIYDPDDIDVLQAIHFVAFQDDDKTIWKQSYRMEEKKDAEGNTTGEKTCYMEEGLFDTSLKQIKEIVPNTDLELPFIPVIIFPCGGLTGETEGRSLMDDLDQMNDEVEKKISDSSDSLRFGMFPIKIFINAVLPTKKDIEAGKAEPLALSPDSIWAANSAYPDKPADFKIVEQKFEYKETLKEHIDRIVGWMHQMANVPQLSPELIKGLGQLSGFAILLLYGAIISATDQAMISWKPRLRRMFGMMLYMLNKYDTKGIYDDKLINDADLTDINLSDLDELIDVKTFMPIPENTAELVEVESKKLAVYLQSIKGAMDALGEEDPERKLAEVISEKQFIREALTPEEELKPNDTGDDDPNKGKGNNDE